MKLVTYREDHNSKLGVCYRDSIVGIADLLSGKRGVPRSMMELLRLDDAGKDDFLSSVSSALKSGPGSVGGRDESQTVFAPPVQHPAKLICMAGNYEAHIKEFDRSVNQVSWKMEYPLLFLKSPTNTLVGHRRSIRIPKGASMIDWEAELAVVVGKGGKNILAANAMDHVFGYSVFNDISDREFQVNKVRNTVDFFRAKCLDDSAPMGPWIVTKEEIPDPHNLSITLRVNGETKQDSNTRYMIFSIHEIIEFVSSLMTLEPGDVIATGTPAGVGASRGEYLKPGDVIEVEIQNVGILVNQVVEESAA